MLLNTSKVNVFFSLISLKYFIVEVLDRSKVKVCIMCHSFYQFMGYDILKDHLW